MRTVAFLLQLAAVLISTAVNTKAIGCFLNFKKNRFSRIVAYLSCWVATGNILFIGDRFNFPVGLAVFVFGMYIACEGSGIRKTAVSIMVSSMILAYNTLADNWAERLFAEASFYIAGRVLFAILFYLAAKRFGPEKEYDLSAPMWWLLLLLSLTPLGIVAAVVMMPSPYWDNLSDMWLHFTLLGIALFSFAGLLWAVSVLAEQKKMEEQVLFAKIKQNYYDTMEARQFEVRRLKHDMANHLQTLAVLPEPKREEYIRELLENDSITKTLNYCGDATVNAVLTAKESMLRRKGITFQWKIEIPGELPFEKIDVCAIFANALDNAAEACERQELPEKTVFLESRLQKGMFLFSVKNPCALEVKAGEMPQTSKKDTENHGFGLQSIREIARRHGGEMTVHAEDGYFELFVYFPCGDD